MKTNNLLADLLSEMAEEAGFFVYEYSCSKASYPNIVSRDMIFEKVDDHDPKISIYKILSFTKDRITLIYQDQNRMAEWNRVEVDLHDPASINVIKEWFESSKDSFSLPYESVFSVFPTYYPALPPSPAPSWSSFPITCGTYTSSTVPTYTTCSYPLSALKDQSITYDGSVGISSTSLSIGWNASSVTISGNLH